MTSAVRSLVRTARAVQASRHGIVYAAPRRKRRPEIALTFDDGPSTAWTPPILDVLQAFGARATFFVLGRAVEGHEDVLQRAVAEGHELGNHAFSHVDPALLSDAEVLAELRRTNALLTRFVPGGPRHFRPPYANTDFRVARVARSLGLRTVLRSVDPADWDQPDAGEIVATVLARARPGSIVCLHDALPPHPPIGHPSRDPTVAALRLLIPELRGLGLRLVTVNELLA